MLATTAGAKTSPLPGGPSCARLNSRPLGDGLFPAVAVLVVLLLLPSVLSAQPASPHPRDPLMTLMLSQPSIDVDSPVVPTASFDPPIIRPGESTTYRVSFNALEASIEWPEHLVTTPPMDLRPGGHGQMLRLQGSAFVPRTGFNYHFRPSAVGQFVVPEFTVQVYGKPVKVPAAQLEVVESLPAPQPPPQRVLLEIPTNDIYVGQPVQARVVMPSTGGGVQFLTQVQLSGEGFIVDQSAARQRVETGTHPGLAANANLYIYETLLTPITSGKLSVFAQGFCGGNPFGGRVVMSGPVVIPGGQSQYTLLDSDPVELQVRPLPREGQLPGFNGAVGNFALAQPALSSNVLAVGDTVKLSVRIFADPHSTLARLVPPAPPRLKDWQVFLSPSETSSPQPVPPQAIAGLESVPPGFMPASFITVQYTLIPLTDKADATPAIPFSYFSPERGAYVDLTIPAVPVSVKPGTALADLGAFARADKAVPEADPPAVLGGLAAAPGLTAGSLVPWQRRWWFPLVQLAPGVVLLGVWEWARRHRFLELHPEIVLRRRARRALRRERRGLLQAARAQDGARFATAAVSAMRVACAPHFPAEPRALVGADVLSVIPEAQRTGQIGEAVRRCFDVTDASRYAATAADAAQLLPLQPQVERVLEELEARL